MYSTQRLFALMGLSTRRIGLALLVGIWRWVDHKFVHQYMFKIWWLYSLCTRTQPKFNLWADHLFKGISIDGAVCDNNDQTSNDQCGVLIPSKSGLKAKKEISIQVDGGKLLQQCQITPHFYISFSGDNSSTGFQNTYIVAERQPITAAIWDWYWYVVGISWY